MTIASPARLTRAARMAAFLVFLCLLLLAPIKAFAAFGLTSDANFYTVDTGANLVFKVRRTDNGSSTQSAGDIASLIYNGVQYQDQSRGSQINGGFDYLYNGVSAVTVSAAVVNTNTVKVTVQAGNLTHYYMARNGSPNIYMATYFTTEPDTLGLCRYIVRIPSAVLPNGPTPSEIRNTDKTVESSDIFGFSPTYSDVSLRGQTRSKHYSNHRLIDWSYIGATGPNVGVWMIRDNNEGGSGGPFYRSLLNQGASDQEITYIINYGEAQTEAYRTSILNGPYILAFTNGSAPNTAIDTSWVAGMGLTGYVADTNRGHVSGAASGIPVGFQGVVGFSNSTAQYWCIVNNGNFASPAMIPGTYAQTLYKGELAVATQSVTVTAGNTTSSNIASAEIVPFQRWRIGEWDGTPAGFLNADKVTTMHPSDVRMTPWGPVTYTVGNSADSSFPCYQWKDVNNPTTIKFNLTADQLTAHTLRIGLTTAYAGGRPQVAVNNWTSSNPSPSTQPDTRTLTIGSYRGNNVTYTYNIPASAFVLGTNTMYLTVISGSGGTGFLSAGYSYDAVELDAPLNDTFRITPQHAQDKAMEVAGSDDSNSVPIDIATYHGAANQQFMLDLQSDGTYRIRTVLAGNRCVELPFGNASNGTVVKLYDDNGNDAQRWQIVPVVGEWCKIVPKNDATKCMDVTGRATADGTIVESYDYNGGSNQLWKFTLVGNESQVQWSAASYTVDEGAGQATITVTRTGNLSVPVSIDYATSDGTAKQPADYAATLGTLSFAAGDSSKTFTIPIVNDTLDEDDETVNLTLSNPQGGAVVSTATTATLTITDNDAPPSVSIGDTIVTEVNAGTTNATFPVTLSAASSKDVTVAYATADGTAGSSDYATTSGTLTIPAGQTSANIVVPVKGDTVAEASETFLVNLSNPVNATIGDGQGVGTIVDNDGGGKVQLSATSYQVHENTATATITLIRSGGSAAMTVQYATSNGTALAGKDYTAASGTLSFAPGESRKTFTISITDDTLAEDDETINITLSNPTNYATLGTPHTAVLTILDNDRSLALVVHPVLFSENIGPSAVTGIVGRTGSRTAPLVVSLFSNNAKLQVPATVTIPAGATTTTFHIVPANNTVADGLLRIVIVAAASGYVAASVPITVNDDEAHLGLSLNRLIFSEADGANAATGTLTRNTPATAPLTVKLTSSNPSKATVPAIVTIPAGATSTTFAVSAIDNSVAEGTVRMSIVARAKGYPTVSNAFTVLDNEACLTLTVNPSTFSEAAQPGSVMATITRNTPKTGALSVALSSSDAGTLKVPSSVQIPAGATSITFPLTIINGSIASGSKSVTLSAGAIGFIAGTAHVIVVK